MSNGKLLLLPYNIFSLHAGQCRGLAFTKKSSPFTSGNAEGLLLLKNIFSLYFGQSSRCFSRNLFFPLHFGQFIVRHLFLK
ncbi:hypothetical protein [Bacillus sp. ISL-45]|uniref:hypothetical protein n=1 Tax=Bacillus sp. ISL-45 TaxID=2819128 RepID=UPI001BE57099|nr:hypothetical protein [Bacillus sp. ISL-45]